MLIEKEIGEGNESVYVYYFQSYRDNEEMWPCKIGRSNKRPESRIKQQQASMVEAPVIGLIIWTNNSCLDEALIHTSLSEMQVPSFGKEWFYTNPAYVEHMYYNGLESRSIGNLVRVARYERGLTQKELASMANIRQETVSIIESGKNTTTHVVERIFAVLNKKLTFTDNN